MVKFKHVILGLLHHRRICGYALFHDFSGKIIHNGALGEIRNLHRCLCFYTAHPPLGFAAAVYSCWT